MTKTTLALLSTLALGALALPAQAQDWASGGNLAHASEGVPGPASNPAFGGGWAGTVTGEAGGSFLRELAVRLGTQDNAESVLAALIAAARG